MIAFGYGEAEALIAALLWPFLRVLALFSAAPVLGDRAVPVRARIGLAFAVALVVAPSLPAPPPGSLGGFGAVGLAAQQVAVGIAIGFAARVAFGAVTLAGDLIGLQMGLSFAGFVDPQHGGQSPLVGSYLTTLAMLVFLSLDGHLALLAAVVDSFRSVPVGPDLLGALRWESLAALGAQLFAWGLHIALPVVAAMLLVNLALGAMTRAAPQLNLFSVGFPVTLLAGLGLIALMLPAVAAPLRAALEASLTFLR